MVQGKINRGRHADHPAGRHSIRTNSIIPNTAINTIKKLIILQPYYSQNAPIGDS